MTASTDPSRPTIPAASPAPRRAAMGIRALLWAGLAGPPVAWALSVAAALGWPGYDPVSGSISVLVNGPAGWLQVLAFLASGGLGLAWAVGMGRVLGVGRRDARRVAGLLGFLALLSFAFAALPTDPGERGVSLVGRLHLLAFGTYAAGLPVILWLLAGVMRRDPRWAAGAGPTRVVGVVLAASLVAVPITLYGPLLPWLGILERVYVAIPSIWQVAVALEALRRIRPA